MNQLKKISREVTPPLVWNFLKQFKKDSNKTEEIFPEIVDYYANASLFALEKLHARGKLSEMILFSLSARINHLADYIAIFSKVYHSTMVPTLIPYPERMCKDRLCILQADFFELEPLPIDCLISHSTIHCMDDSRYGNTPERLTGIPKPYRVAEKIRYLIGNKAVPIFVTVAVNHREDFTINNSWLSHRNFVDSFLKGGFKLEDCYFDYMTGGVANPLDYKETFYRRCQSLPEPSDKQIQYVAGTYFFL